MKCIVVLIIIAGYLNTTTALSCLPCKMVKCKTITCDRGGLGKDMCGCCGVCAKTYNETCGGPWRSSGKCDGNLTCNVENSGELSKGICTDEDCKEIVDIIIAMDGSKEIGEENFNISKNITELIIKEIYEMFGACAYVEVLQYGNKDENIEKYKAAAKDEIIPFAIGVGDCDLANLKTIANGAMNNDRVYTYKTYADLEGSIADKLTDAIWNATVENKDEETKCGDGQVYKTCTSTCKPTCDDPNPVSMTSCGPAGCECTKGYVQKSSKDTTCVKKESCEEEIKPGECTFPQVYKSCTSTCKPTCDAPNPICILSCAPPGCECASGYVQKSSKDITCVKKENCKTTTVKECTFPLVYKTCTSHCKPTCDNPTPACIESCAPAGCECARGYVQKSDQDATCVKKENCKSICSYPEVFRTCNTNCPGTCDDPTPSCNRACAPPGCSCDKGYVQRSKADDTCVKLETCSKKKNCIFPEVHTDCALLCDPTCDDPMPACAEICKLNECVCANDYVRKSAANSTCILKNECPRKQPVQPANGIGTTTILLIVTSVVVAGFLIIAVLRQRKLEHKIQLMSGYVEYTAQTKPPMT